MNSALTGVSSFFLLSDGEDHKGRKKMYDLKMIEPQEVIYSTFSPPSPYN
jgi:hypothetical protein